MQIPPSSMVKVVEIVEFVVSSDRTGYSRTHYQRRSPAIGRVQWPAERRVPVTVGRCRAGLPRWGSTAQVGACECVRSTGV